VNIYVKFIVITSIFLSFHSQTKSQEINVGLEPFPPMINNDGSGFAINMLNALTEDDGLQFNFQLMTYARAKKELKNNRIDLIGLTPKDYETSEFYQYATELNWSFKTTVDLFSTSVNLLNINNLPDRSIGTLSGNAEFFSEKVNLNKEKFVEVASLEQLVQMMVKGRLKLVVFERVSMMSTIKELKIKNIYYKKFAVLSASLAVANNPQGIALKTKLDNLLSQNDSKQFLAEFSRFTNLSDEGMVSF